MQERQRYLCSRRSTKAQEASDVKKELAAACHAVEARGKGRRSPGGLKCVIKPTEPDESASSCSLHLTVKRPVNEYTAELYAGERWAGASTGMYRSLIIL